MKLKFSFELVKKIYCILAGATNLVTYLVVIFCTNPSSEKFVEYTTLSRFFINFYTLLLLTILLLHSIYPNIICGIFSKNMNILSSNKGKITIYFIVSSMYWSTDSVPHFLYAAISFVATLGMLICEIVFDCEILKGKNFDTINTVNNSAENKKQTLTLAKMIQRNIENEEKENKNKEKTNANSTTSDNTVGDSNSNSYSNSNQADPPVAQDNIDKINVLVNDEKEE